MCAGDLETSNPQESVLVAKKHQTSSKPKPKAVVAKRPQVAAAPAVKPQNVFGASKPIPDYTPTPPSKPRPKGAPPPVIAKPKPKPKVVDPKEASRTPKKRIDFAQALTVGAAARSLRKVDPGGYVTVSGRRVRVFSLKSVKPKRRTGKAAVKAALKPATIAPPLEQPKIGKTKLSKKELTLYRDMLVQQRGEIVGRVEGMERDALRSDGGNLSTMPLHPADIGTDTYDQDFALNQAERERHTLTEIDEALERIADRTFGVCLHSGKPIPKARLNVTPWAKYTVDSARALERAARRR